MKSATIQWKPDGTIITVSKLDDESIFVRVYMGGMLKEFCFPIKIKEINNIYKFLEIPVPTHTG
jgi:hypothetical protein